MPKNKFELYPEAKLNKNHRYVFRLDQNMKSKIENFAEDRKEDTSNAIRFLLNLGLDVFSRVNNRCDETKNRKLY